MCYFFFQYNKWCFVEIVCSRILHVYYVVVNIRDRYKKQLIYTTTITTTKFHLAAQRRKKILRGKHVTSININHRHHNDCQHLNVNNDDDDDEMMMKMKRPEIQKKCQHWKSIICINHVLNLCCFSTAM